MNNRKPLRIVGVIGVVAIVIAQSQTNGLSWEHYLGALVVIVALISPEAIDKLPTFR